MVRFNAPLAGGFSSLLMVLAIGCGPVTSTVDLNDAEIAVEQARLEQAADYAVYEFVSAEEYLQKAREEWAYSDFQHAAEYAERALELARAARERAMNSPNRVRGGRGGTNVDDLDDP